MFVIIHAKIASDATPYTLMPVNVVSAQEAQLLSETQKSRQDQGQMPDAPFRAKSHRIRMTIFSNLQMASKCDSEFTHAPASPKYTGPGK